MMQPPTRKTGTFPYIATVLERTDYQSLNLSSLDYLGIAIEEAVPVPPRHRHNLKGDIRILWEQLTSRRQSRSADYLGTPSALSAYVRYFMPWNVLRLLSIFSRGEFPLSNDATIIDIGSGPLTVPIALYLAYPELRSRALSFICHDRTERIMKTGQTIFETLCVRVEGKLPPWKFTLKKGDFGMETLERASMITAANVFNEFFWKGKESLGERADALASVLRGSLREDGVVFIMEPGDPRSGSFISAIRASFLEKGLAPIAPCTHDKSCPMPGFFKSRPPEKLDPLFRGSAFNKTSTFGNSAIIMPHQRDKYPWCHFTVATDISPSWLREISDIAGLPKDKLSYSYLIAKASRQALPPHTRDTVRVDARKGESAKLPAPEKLMVRIVSEEFNLPGTAAERSASGRYACSPLGYTLVRRNHESAHFSSGDLVLFEKSDQMSKTGFHAPLAPKNLGFKNQSQSRRRDEQQTERPEALALDEKSGAGIVSY
jgi:hypothetical protein